MRKGIGCLCVVLGLSIITSPVHASIPPYELPNAIDNRMVFEGEYISSASEEASSTLHLSVDEAVAYGLDHNLALKSLANQLLLANIKLSSASDNGYDLKVAKSDLNAAGVKLDEKEAELLASKEALRTAEVTLEDGFAPVDIQVSEDVMIKKGAVIRSEVTRLVELQAEALINSTVVEKQNEIEITIQGVIDGWPETMATEKSVASAALASDVAPFDVPLSEDFSIEKGRNITDSITALVEAGATTDEKVAEKKATVDEIVAQIIKEVENGFRQSEGGLDEAEIAIGEATSTLQAKWSTYEGVISDVSREMEDMIGYSSTISLDAGDAKKLMIKMANVNLSVTDYAQDIYRNQVAMLIRKDYYDALYAEKMLKVREKAAERGEVQFGMIQLSYDNGMKAKDDYLLAKMYYDGTQLESRLAEAAYNNALYTLKNDMNLNMGYEVILSEPLEVIVTEENLDEALKSGLTNRIEIQQSLGEQLICELNVEIIDDMSISAKKKYQETEALILLDEAEIGLEKNKYNVSAQIHQSYELMIATGEMIAISADLIKNAEEVVAIAQLKYDQGLGTESALLSSMNLESSGGTVLEVIAAQENLTKIEAQVANINYKYLMAKCKFYNDAAILAD